MVGGGGDLEALTVLFELFSSGFPMRVTSFPLVIWDLGLRVTSSDAILQEANSCFVPQLQFSKKILIFGFLY